MKVNVLYFGVIRERIAGKKEEVVDLPEGSTLREVFDAVNAAHPGLERMVGHMRVSLNQALASPEQAVADGDEVAFIPPMAGGSERYCRVTDERLSLDDMVDAVSGPTRGGIVTFIGTVRDNSGGRKVTAIEYESYRPMALASLSNIIDRCEALAEDVRVAVAHRTGLLSVGETVVIIAAAGPRRAEAFQAARTCAELMKWETAIWRKEIGPDGEIWVGAPDDLTPEAS